MKPTEHSTKAPHTATGLFALLGGLFSARGTGASKMTKGTGAPSPTPILMTLATIAAALLASAGLTAALPTTASAYATPQGPPVYSSAPGLPDGRVYEQVSPGDKNANEAGAEDKRVNQDSGAEHRYSVAATDGNSVLFEGTGPMGEAATAINPFFIATKNQGAGGWSTRGVTPAPLQSAAELGGFLSHVGEVDPSSDLSHVMFVPSRGTYAPVPEPCTVASLAHNVAQLYLSGSDPFVPATWLEKTEGEGPAEACRALTASGVPVGGTPDFSTVYFTDPGTLLPEDASRAPHAIPQNGTGDVEAWGFYENREGSLREAGVLPGGGLDPFGAVPAASGHGAVAEGAAYSDDEISADGSRAFFVSPDPASCTTNGGQNNCTTDPPELYVRESGDRTQLVSRDTLLPAVKGLSTAAPTGVLPAKGSYVFASPDGSQAFFQSEDKLTFEAPEGPPGNTTPKTYDFDVDTGVLTYLPNVAGQIVATDTEGTSFAFVRPEAGGEPAELDLWSGPGAGRVTPVTQLPEPGGSVAGTRMSSAGSVLVFLTGSLLPGAFNSGGFQQVYRYDVPANTLGCVSCPPHGVSPTGSAGFGNAASGISADGNRIFFETPDPLVPQDTNTGTKLERNDGDQVYFELQGSDVYEWENGVVYLLSSGKSSVSSYLLANGESGGDVFFATAEGLVPGDTDGVYDVYDARVPHPGDSPPPAAVPCEGAVCQGPPNVPSPLTPPASATFSGLGNPAPEVTHPPPPAKTTTKTVKCKRGFTKKNKKCVTNKKKTKAKKPATTGGQSHEVA